MYTLYKIRNLNSVIHIFIFITVNVNYFSQCINLLHLKNLQSNFLTDTSGRAVTQYILVLRLVKTGIAYEKQHFIRFIYLIFISFSCLIKKKEKKREKV